MECPKCNSQGAKKLKPLVLSFVEQGLGEGVANYVRINAPVACPQCGLLLLFGDSFKLPEAGLIPELVPATKI